MGIENPVHLLFLAAIALIVLGPKRLPALAKALGEGIREFRSSLTEGALHGPAVEQPPASGAAQLPVVTAEPASAVPGAAAPASAVPAPAAPESPARPHDGVQAGQ